jgi:hypothetical protein
LETNEEHECRFCAVVFIPPPRGRNFSQFGSCQVCRRLLNPGVQTHIEVSKFTVIAR